jgi:hypothetical protein
MKKARRFCRVDLLEFSCAEICDNRKPFCRSAFAPGGRVKAVFHGEKTR